MRTSKQDCTYHLASTSVYFNQRIMMIFCVSYFSGKPGPLSNNPQTMFLLQKLVFFFWFIVALQMWGSGILIKNICSGLYVFFPLKIDIFNKWVIGLRKRVKKKIKMFQTLRTWWVFLQHICMAISWVLLCFERQTVGSAMHAIQFKPWFPSS